MQDKPIAVDKRDRILRWLIVGYVILVHVILIAAIISPITIERVKHVFSFAPMTYSSYKGQVTAHVIQDASMPKGCVVFIGDSIVSKLDLTAVVDSFAVNYGIISDTTAGALWRIPQYRNLKSTGVIVLAVGVNDLSYIGDDNIISNYGKILKLLPCSVPVIISGILPLKEDLLKQSNITYLTGKKATNARIKSINKRTEELCQSYANVSFIDATEKMADETGNIRQEFTVDGVHLTPSGYKAWADFLKAHISEILERRHERGNEIPALTD